MGRSCISNPPYNIAWLPAPFAGVQPRFALGVPPKSNANLAFVLTALDMIDGRAAFLLPNGVLTSDQREEKEIRAALIEQNYIDAIITLPDSMFESTSIPICALVLNKNKRTRTVEMIDLRQTYEERTRDQRGQYGGASHEGRVYHKTVKVLTDETIDNVCHWIAGHEDVPGLCRSVQIEELRASGYQLTPARYIAQPEVVIQHRPYADIAADYNRIIAAKNAVRLTVNETLAKALGLYIPPEQMAHDMNEAFALVGQKADKENYIRFTRAAEFRVEARSHGQLPEILLLFVTLWKQRVMALNNEENRILAEMRDAMLPELMNGKLKVGAWKNDCEGQE